MDRMDEEPTPPAPSPRPAQEPVDVLSPIARWCLTLLGVVVFVIAMVWQCTGWPFWPAVTATVAGTVLLGVASRGRPGQLTSAAASSFPVRLGLLITAVAVLLMGGLEIGHPADLGANPYEALLHDHSTAYWIWLHVLQGIGLVSVAVGLALVATAFPRVWQIPATITLIVFGALYTTFDSVAGIAVGVITTRSPEWGLPPSTASEVVNAMFRDSVVGGGGSVLSLSATVAWSVAMTLVVIGLSRIGASLWVIVLLGVTTGLIAWAHTFWFGPVGFLCALIALLLLWRTFARVDAGGASTPPVDR